MLVVLYMQKEKFFLFVNISMLLQFFFFRDTPIYLRFFNFSIYLMKSIELTNILLNACFFFFLMAK